MARRRGARRIALEVLYEHDMSGKAVEEILGRYASYRAAAYAAVLVRGVKEHLSQLDGLISSYAEDWEPERMPVIDRNLLRLGVFEIMYVSDVPPAVTIDELVEVAKRYSTEASGRFVNGVLARIAEEAGNLGI